MSTVVDRVRSSATHFLSLCAVAFGVASCQGAEGVVLGSAQRLVRPAPQPISTRAQIVTVEFDAPPDYTATASNGRPSVRGFQVGFFAGARLVRAIEIPRDAVRLAAGKIRLDVPLTPVTRPADSSVALKVRSLSVGPLGPWSAVAGSVTLPITPRPGRPARGAAASGAARAERRDKSRKVEAADIEGHAALKVALAQVLDNGLSEDEALGCFAKVQDLAAAVVLAPKLKLSFAKLCQAVQAAPRKSLADGLKAMEPSIDSAAEIRGASSEVKRLLGGRPRRPRAQ